MMKSFFKKLAFVMALAMVVTMAAPAGTAALAADFYIADETGAKAETFKLAIGEKEDFKFKGASDYKNYTWKWVSSNEKVASVDAKTGLVTGVADGVATITLTGGNKYKATCEITVGKGEVAVSNGAYTVKQTTATEIEVYFDGKQAYTKDDITLEFVLDAEAGYKVQWPIETVTAIDNGFKIKPYVNFSNGDTYVLTIGANDKGTTFKTVFGQPDSIKLSYSCQKQANVAYVSPEDDQYPVSMEVKFFSGDVDVTSLYKETASVAYNVKLNTDEDNAWLDGSDLYFTATGVGVIVEAIYSDYDAEGNYFELAAETGVITPVKAPEYVIKGVTNWSIVDATTKSIDWKNPVQDIAAYDDEELNDCKIVVLIVDSEGNYYVSDDRFVDKDNKIYGSANSVAPSKFVTEGYSIKFESSDTSKLLVGTDGSLTTYIDAYVPVIVSLHNEYIEYSESNPDGFVKYVGAPSVEVTKQRAIKTLAAGTKNYDVVTRANADSFRQTKITLTLKDQHGDAWRDVEDIEVTPNIEGVIVDEDNVVTYDGEKAEFIVDGGELLSQMGKKTSVNLTLKVKDTNVSTVVTLKLRKPSVNTKTDTIIINKSSLVADSIDQKVTKDEKIPAKNTIKLTEFNGTIAVGLATDVVLYDSETTYTEANTTKGERFLIVYNANNVPVKVGSADTLGVYSSEAGVFHVTVATTKADSSEIEYLPTGTYTARVTTVTGFDTKEGTAIFAKQGTGVYNTTFTVSNTSSEVQFVKIATGKTSTDMTDIFDIVADTLEFNLNGANWAFTVADIADVEYRYNAEAGENGYVIITKVHFMVPVDGGVKDAEGMVKYYIDEVVVNKAIELNSGLVERAEDLPAQGE